MEQVNVYDENARYVFTNWTEEDFVGRWNDQPTLIKAGEVKEMPMYLAYHFCKHLVDRELIRDKKESGLADPAVRKDYEDKTIRAIAQNEESPEKVALRAAIREELKKEMQPDSAPVADTVDSSPTELKTPSEFEGVQG